MHKAKAYLKTLCLNAKNTNDRMINAVFEPYYHIVEKDETIEFDKNITIIYTNKPNKTFDLREELETHIYVQLLIALLIALSPEEIDWLDEGGNECRKLNVMGIKLDKKEILFEYEINQENISSSSSDDQEKEESDIDTEQD